MSEKPFFIGWSADTPAVDRRFFLGSGAGLMLAAGGLAFGLARHQNTPNSGRWDMGDIREWRGIATAEPYSMLRTRDFDGTPRTLLLGCQGKCGVAARIGALAGKPVIVKGSPIVRGEQAMIAVIDGMDWITEDPEGTLAGLAFPETQAVQDVTLQGQILDTKCWFGAMSPAEGKVHKACAALCIRGGIPPAFFVKDVADQKALMIMTDRGLAHGDDLLAYVGEPVELTGQLQRRGDQFLIDGPVSGIRRLSVTL